MTPKSLLRHPLAAATLQALTQESFQPVMDDRTALEHADAVRRVVLCTGKIAIDLLSHASRAQANDVAIVRVEMLYPFPAEALRKTLANYAGAREVVWVQEEPLNMGAGGYMAPQLADLTGTRFSVECNSAPCAFKPCHWFLRPFPV